MPYILYFVNTFLKKRKVAISATLSLYYNYLPCHCLRQFQLYTYLNSPSFLLLINNPIPVKLLIKLIGKGILVRQPLWSFPTNSNIQISTNITTELSLNNILPYYLKNVKSFWEKFQLIKTNFIFIHPNPFVNRES